MSKPISGHGEFQFGMTLDQVASITSLTPQGGSGNWYSTDSELFILGQTYEYSLKFSNQILVQVNLNLSLQSSEIDCNSHFSNILTEVVTNYGEPDQPPIYEEGDISIPISTNIAEFTAQDGSGIMVASAFGTECVVFVAYKVAPVAGSF